MQLQVYSLALRPARLSPLNLPLHLLIHSLDIIHTHLPKGKPTSSVPNRDHAARGGGGGKKQQRTFCAGQSMPSPADLSATGLGMRWKWTWSTSWWAQRPLFCGVWGVSGRGSESRRSDGAGEEWKRRRGESGKGGEDARHRSSPERRLVLAFSKNLQPKELPSLRSMSLGDPAGGSREDSRARDHFSLRSSRSGHEALVLGQVPWRPARDSLPAAFTLRSTKAMLRHPTARWRDHHRLRR